MFGFTKDKYIIVGCGGFGSSLAGLLSADEKHVIIIDLLQESFKRLPPHYSGFEVVGDGTDVGIYTQIKLQENDTIVVSTDNDNVNCMIAEMATRIFQINNVYARLTDPAKERVIEGFGIKTIYPVRLSVHEFMQESGMILEGKDGSK